MIRPASLFSWVSPLPWALSLTLHAGVGTMLLGDSTWTEWLTPAASRSGEIRFTVTPRTPEPLRVPRRGLRVKQPDWPRIKPKSVAISETSPPNITGQTTTESNSTPAPTATQDGTAPEEVLREYAGRARHRIQTELDDLEDIQKLPKAGLQLKLWLAQDGAVERLEISGDHDAIDEDSLRKIREKVKQAGPFEALPAGIPRLAIKVPLRTRAEK